MFRKHAFLLLKQIVYGVTQGFDFGYPRHLTGCVSLNKVVINVWDGAA